MAENDHRNKQGWFQYLVAKCNVVVFLFLSWNREAAETDIHEFVEQLRPNGRTDTAIFSLQDYGRQH